MKTNSARFFSETNSCAAASNVSSRSLRSRRPVARAILGFLLCCSAVTVHAADHLFQLPATGNTGHEWLCETTDSRQHGWILQCRDLVAAFASDPVLSNDRDATPSQIIPLFSAPFADSDLDQLASSVLCLGLGARSCRVMIAAH
jgi:hypothetical protein